jgi:hypothetical protein
MMNARSVLSGLKHQKEKRNMDYFAGLDVSVKETSVCIVDDTGKIVRETRVASEPVVAPNAAEMWRQRGLHDCHFFCRRRPCCQKQRSGN